MTKDRNINEVIDAILAVEELPQLTRTYLDKLKETAGYTPPEMGQNDWHSFQLILAQEVGRPNGVAWKQRVQDIFNGRIPSRNKKLTMVEKVNIIRLMNGIRKRVQRRYEAFTENTPITNWFEIVEEECKDLPVTVIVESGKEPGQTIVVKHNDSDATLRITLRLDENDVVQSEFYESKDIHDV